jgi:hypothetical protein
MRKDSSGSGGLTVAIKNVKNIKNIKNKKRKWILEIWARKLVKLASLFFRCSIR